MRPPRPIVPLPPTAGRRVRRIPRWVRPVRRLLAELDRVGGLVVVGAKVVAFVPLGSAGGDVLVAVAPEGDVPGLRDGDDG